MYKFHFNINGRSKLEENSSEWSCVIQLAPKAAAETHMTKYPVKEALYNVCKIIRQVVFERFLFALNNNYVLNQSHKYQHLCFFLDLTIPISLYSHQVNQFRNKHFCNSKTKPKTHQ